MIYRKNILLALLEIFGGELGATDFQKLLFLYSEKQNERKYNFIPYKYGCFSFQAMADKNSLIKEEYLVDSKNWKLNLKNANFIFSLSDADRKTMRKLNAVFCNHSTSDLIRHIYLNYPFFAIKSEIVSKYLSEDESRIIERFRPVQKDSGIFTIGYEGRSLEEYLNILIQQNIRVLCDVRKNPLSRKYGFAKKTLSNACESVNIKYIHIPELGIISDKRKSLRTQLDYDNLFLDYEKNILPLQQKSMKLIQDLLSKYGRIALTCYEALPKQCHRTRIANAIHNEAREVPLKHL
jgi:uncharacterized protein (DUF488 family)